MSNPAHSMPTSADAQAIAFSAQAIAAALNAIAEQKRIANVMTIGQFYTQTTPDGRSFGVNMQGANEASSAAYAALFPEPAPTEGETE